jgi:hypothetical protein
MSLELVTLGIESPHLLGPATLEEVLSAVSGFWFLSTVSWRWPATGTGRETGESRARLRPVRVTMTSLTPFTFLEAPPNIPPFVWLDHASLQNLRASSVGAKSIFIDSRLTLSPSLRFSPPLSPGYSYTVVIPVRSAT